MADRVSYDHTGQRQEKGGLLEMRNEKVMIRVSEGEKAIMESAAARLGLPLASWARFELARLAKQPSPTDDAETGENGKKPQLLSLFCGPGGLDQGFRGAGFHTALAFDNDEDCVSTFGWNHKGSKAFVRDIRKQTLEELDLLYGKTFEPTGVIGGPPCQSFSVSNVHQTDNDPRHKLPEAYARLLKKLNERSPISFFLFENVPGLLGTKHIRRYNNFKDLFGKAGFHITERLLNAKDFGVPQDRPRIFIVGINESLHPNTAWTPPSRENHVRSVRDTIGGFPEPVLNDRGLDPNSIPYHPNHWCLVPRSKKFQNADLKEGQAWGRSFRTLCWDEPSWTVAYGHREVHVHPNGRRRLSIYEAMQLQTFPHEYRLLGNMSAQIRLVSEAVPPRLAWHIANSIRQSLGI
jgi:DNA (cytosine-5)-methyltransferase 1